MPFCSRWVLYCTVYAPRPHGQLPSNRSLTESFPPWTLPLPAPLNTGRCHAALLGYWAGQRGARGKLAVLLSMSCNAENSRAGQPSVSQQCHADPPPPPPAGRTPCLCWFVGQTTTINNLSQQLVPCLPLLRFICVTGVQLGQVTRKRRCCSVHRPEITGTQVKVRLPRTPLPNV